MGKGIKNRHNSPNRENSRIKPNWRKYFKQYPPLKRDLLLEIIAFFAGKVNGQAAGFSESVFARKTDVLDKGGQGDIIIMRYAMQEE